MKVISSLSLLVLLVSTSACKPTQSVLELLYEGTVKGVEACVNIKSSTLLSEDDVKQFCTEKHQKILTVGSWNVSGRARFGAKGIRADIDNDLIGYIITEIQFETQIFDAEGKMTSHFATSPSWILPKNTSEVDAFFEEQIEENKIPSEWCSRKPDGEKAIECKSWQILRVKTIEF